jgi:hypothetical protein
MSIVERPTKTPSAKVQPQSGKPRLVPFYSKVDCGLFERTSDEMRSAANVVAINMALKCTGISTDLNPYPWFFDGWLGKNR